VTADVALVFPGQGSQRHGMLDALPCPKDVARLLDAAEALSGIDLREVAASGTPEQLADTRAAQPLLYLADWAWGHEALRAGIAPLAVAGHSLGEFAALATAGVFSVEAGLELVVERARLMAECAAETPGGMAAVLGIDADTLGAAVAEIEGVWIANDNAPGQMVVSGTFEGLRLAEPAALAAGARRVVPLQVAGAFHTPLMARAADAFRLVLGEAAFLDAAIPVVQNSRPEPARDAETLRRALAAQIVSPVRWTETMRALVTLGADTLVECGPGSVLKGLARRIDGVRAVSVDEEGGLDSILEEVS
jgi:[acyl-carrier-protein] S-malonyltransferase